MSDRDAVSGSTQPTRPQSSTDAGDAEPVLRVRNVSKYFPVTSDFLGRHVGNIKAVDGVNFDVKSGETLAIVGESGCGKSTLAETLAGAHPPTSGSIYYQGRDVEELSDSNYSEYRRDVGMVFQDPSSSLNDRMTVGSIVREPLRIHGMARGKQRRKVRDALETVGLDPELVYSRFPHELSGGQKQRVSIARTLILEPKVLIADEPVSALDVSMQAQILTLLADLQRELDLTTVLISHDLSVVKYVADRVGVMYLGRMVELSEGDSIFGDPQHPYTEALLSSIPRVDPTHEQERIVLPGQPPDPRSPPAGCNFAPRCQLKRELSEERQARCTNEDPAAADCGTVACHFCTQE
jgi:oligopeptide/dipeptide ABC transporter ATP-binding protein